MTNIREVRIRITITQFIFISIEFYKYSIHIKDLVFMYNHYLTN